MKKPNYIQDICTSIKELQKSYPTQNLGRHLDNILSEYPSPWGISDKELSFAFQKYQQTLELDPIATESEVDKIIRETDELFKYTPGIDNYDLDEEEEDY